MMNAIGFKNEGNKFFASRKFDDAIRCYTKAIKLNPTTATFFTNRGLCYLKLRNWNLALQDCQRAIDLDRSLVKGHFFLGEALLELDLLDEAISHLLKAYGLSKDQKLNFGDEVTAVLRQARKRKWSMAEGIRIQQEIALQSYVTKLINEDRDRNIEQCRKNYKNKEAELEIEKIDYEQDLRLKGVNDLFSQNDDRRKKRDIPDYLCGKISFELMQEPVITPSGITFNKKDIIEHLQRVGHFDPLTRAPLTQDQLIPNLAMKEVIDYYLESNPWAEDY